MNGITAVDVRSFYRKADLQVVKLIHELGAEVIADREKLGKRLAKGRADASRPRRKRRTAAEIVAANAGAGAVTEQPSQPSQPSRQFAAA